MTEDTLDHIEGLANAEDEEDIEYLLDYLADHLTEAGRDVDLRHQITPKWLELKRTHQGLDAYRSMARDISLALKALPTTTEELPEFLRLCVLAGTLNTLVTDMPPEALAALSRAGRIDEALTAVTMMTGRRRRVTALHSIASGCADMAPIEAGALWLQAQSLAEQLPDDAQAGRLLAAIARGRTEAWADGSGLGPAELADQRLTLSQSSGAADELLIAEGRVDLAAVHLACGRATQAQHHLHQARPVLARLTPRRDEQRFSAVFEAFTGLAVGAQDPGLRTVPHECLWEDPGQATLLAATRMTRATALAACAVGARRAGDPDLAARALDQAKATAGRKGTIGYFSTLAMAVAAVRPHAVQEVKEAVAAIDSLIRELDTKEAQLRTRATWGPTRMDALSGNAARIDHGRDGAEIRLLHQENRVTRCAAYARAAVALQRIGDTRAAADRFARATEQIAGLPGDRGTAITALLAAAPELNADAEAATAVTASIVDRLMLDWTNALEGAINGPEGSDTLIRTHAGAADVQGLLRMASAARSSGKQPEADVFRAELAYELARSGQGRRARRLARTAGRRPRWKGSGDHTFHRLALAADAFAALGRTRAAHRRLRSARRAMDRWSGEPETILGLIGGLIRLILTDDDDDQWFESPESVTACCAAMLRPALLSHDIKTTRWVVDRLTRLRQPHLLTAALADGISRARQSDPEPEFPAHLRAPLSAALVAASQALPDDVEANLRVLQALEDLRDEEAAAAVASSVLDHGPGRSALLRFRADACLIGDDRPDHLKNALTAVSAQDDPDRRRWMIGVVLDRLRYRTYQPTDTDLHRLLELVEADNDPESAAALLDYGIALAPGIAHVTVVTAATHSIRRLSLDAPYLNAALAKAAAVEDDRSLATTTLAAGARSAARTVSDHDDVTARADTEPGAIAGYLEAAAPALRTLDPTGTLQRRIWSRIHSLDGFRTEHEIGGGRRHRPPVADIAVYTLAPLILFPLYWPYFTMINYIGVSLMVWIGSGSYGPWWLVAGAALMGTTVRAFRSVSRREQPPSRWAAATVCPFMAPPMLLGAWCSANGFVRHWLSGVFHGSPTAVAVLFTISCCVIAVTLGYQTWKIWQNDPRAHGGVRQR
ncbi:hypothetical protein [Streptomyces flaveus]|uniref:hypothetical protein n=1 Tax=Streptomyces flaveus TaxID=66370 RepID=UPI00331AF481